MLTFVSIILQTFGLVFLGSILAGYFYTARPKKVINVGDAIDYHKKAIESLASHNTSSNEHVDPDVPQDHK